MKSSYRPIIKTTLFALLMCCSSQSFAWGPTGHRVTGWVAEKYLSTKAKKNLETLLRGESLAMLSTWMDEVRSDSGYRYMDDWHWVTIHEGKSYEQMVKNKNGDLIETIERTIHELKSRKLSLTEERERIKILIHLIGDLHQPLHVGSKDDRGGNDVKLFWFKNESNLHRVWDSEMIDESRLSYTELAQSLPSPSLTQIKQWQNASIRSWAMENHSFTDQVYNIGDGRLGYSYSYKNLPLVRQRLLQAGVRLAGILNDIFEKR